MTFKSKGRLAGVVYFLLVLTGIFNLMYVPGQLISFQDPAFTLKQITSNELLFRSGITVGIVSYVIYLILPLILFDIFKHVDRHSAVLMAGLAIVSVPVAIFNMVDQVNVLSLLSDASYLQSLSLEQIQTQVMLLLQWYCCCRNFLGPMAFSLWVLSCEIGVYTKNFRCISDAGVFGLSN